MLKTIDYAVEKEFGKTNLAMADKLAYEMRDHARPDSPGHPLLNQLIAALRANELQLPVLPDSVSHVMRLISLPDVDIADLAGVVELDPALAIKTVGVANSAYYQGASPSVSVHEALMRMGLRNARNIVSAVALRSSLFRVEGYETEAQSIWIHSLLTAVSTEKLLSDVPPWQSTGFLLGLAHDIGRISMLGFAAELKDRDRRGAGACPATVQEVSSLVHAQVGALAVDSWGFSEDFVVATARHHDPDQVSDHRIVLARALHVGDAFAHWVGEHAMLGETEVGGVLLEQLESVGIEEKDVEELTTEVQTRFNEMSEIA